MPPSRPPYIPPDLNYAAHEPSVINDQIRSDLPSFCDAPSIAPSSLVLRLGVVLMVYLLGVKLPQPAAWPILLSSFSSLQQHTVLRWSAEVRSPSFLFVPRRPFLLYLYLLWRDFDGIYCLR